MKPDNDAEPIPAGEQDQADDQEAVPVLPCRHESANASISLPLAVARGFVTPSQSAPDLRSPATTHRSPSPALRTRLRACNRLPRSTKAASRQLFMSDLPRHVRLRSEEHTSELQSRP